jgi:hypothetical protein
MAFNWATYQSATGCTRYGPAGAQALQTYLEDWFSAQTSLGICNCRVVSGSASYSHHAECRAYDEGHAVSVAGGQLAVATLNLLGPHGARLGIDHFIVNHNPTGAGRGDPRIYSASSPNGRVYTGTHPHKDHNHIGLTRNAGRNLTYATLVAVAGVPPIGGGEDDMLGFSIGQVGEASLPFSDRSAALQLMLRDRGISVGVDGRAGDLTRQALIAFQQAQGIGVPELGSGTIGAYTYAALYEPSSGSGLDTEQVTTIANKAVAAHAAKPGKEVHPHGHDEGQTGPAI